ncbi:MAG: G1 family glutamic endopeptidase [Candidatus Bathyarchaeia archaeon]
MKTSTKVSAFFVGLLMLLAAFSPAFALTSAITAPNMVVARSDGSSWSSTNWSGYAVTGATGSVTSASGSWTVTAVSSGTIGQYAAFWVGIDGFSSSTVEQTGTLAETVGTTVEYYAWYEFYPSPMYQITSLTIKPGDEISASVTYTGTSGGSGRGFFGRQSSTFIATIKDMTTGKSYTTTQSVNNAARSSAEFIAEAPSSYRGVLPLANFGTVNYGLGINTLAPGTCYATVGGVSGALGSFGSAVQEITMVTNAGVTKALPSAPLSSEGTSFSVAWKSAGP